jgi:hypothetical protein
MAGEIKLEVEAGRQLYFYGEGDGRRVLGVKEIAEKTGLHPETVRKWIKVWAKDFEVSLAKTSPLGRGLALSAEAEDENNANMHFYADQVRQIRYELKIYEQVLEKLEGICENFSLNSDNGDKALQLFSTYLNTLGSKSSLRQQYLKLESRWSKLSGVEAIQDIAVTTEKEVAKIQGKKRGEEAVKEESPRHVPSTPTGFFATRKQKALDRGVIEG